MTPSFFPTQQAFRNWLEKHHKKTTELLVGFYKVGSGKPSLTWPEAVDQALCFGWIDGVRKSMGEESYSIRFTPRKTSSIWSAVNIKKMEALKKAGLMKREGLEAYSHRKEHKSKIYSYEKAASNLDTSFEKKFKSHKEAWSFFEVQTPSYKKLMIHWITDAKLAATRLSRLKKTIEASAVGKRLR